MTAGLTAMRLHDAEAVARLNRIGRLARDGLDEAIRASGVPASVTGAGSMFWIHLEAEAPRDYRSAFPTQREKAALDALLQALEDERILVIGTAAGMLSTPMGEAEIDALAEAVLASLRRIAPLLDA
jgi:glutamate-1-semialdehyde 2,1-aminomutase